MISIFYFDVGWENAYLKTSQVAHPAYQSQLSHLRARTLDHFKEAFDKALHSGKAFAAAACECCQNALSQLDEGFSGINPSVLTKQGALSC